MAGEPKLQQVTWQTPPPLDLRFEVTHRPTPQMWEAMMAVVPGMASRGEDAVLRRLEERVAELTGHDAAYFVPTATAGALAVLMTRDLRGQHLVMESRCHLFWVERNSGRLAGAVPRLLEGDAHGAMDPTQVEAVITETHYGRVLPTGLVCLENTHNVCGGTVLTAEHTAAIADVAHRHGVEVYLDGARIFNAAVAQGVPVSALTASCDHVVVSLNKALGAPLGALVCGRAEFVARLPEISHRLGFGTVHKAGIFAAAGLVALDTMIERLADDHLHAREIARAIHAINPDAVDPALVETNMVRIDTSPFGLSAIELANAAARRGLAISVMGPAANKIVLSYEIGDAEVASAIEILSDVLAERVATV